MFYFKRLFVSGISQLSDWFVLRSMKVSNSRDTLFRSVAAWSGSQDTKQRNKTKHVPVNYHLLLEALCNYLLLEVSCSCHQSCFRIKTLELKLWSPGGKGVAPDLKPAAWVPLASLPPVSFEAHVSLWNKMSQRMQCWCPLVGGKRDIRRGKKLWHISGTKFKMD